MYYLSSLSLQGKSARTASSYIAALGTWHKLQDMQDPTQHFLVRKMLSGFSKEGRNKDTRQPITGNTLHSILNVLHLVCSSSYETKLFIAAYTSAFFGFFRVSELVPNSAADTSNRSLSINDVNITDNAASMHVTLRYSKTDQAGIGTCIQIKAIPNSPLCPVAAMVNYLAARPLSSHYLFIHFDGKQLTRFQFQAVLQKAVAHLDLPHCNYTSHSFRIGAATTAAMNGVDAETIKRYGRWASDCYLRYIRI